MQRTLTNAQGKLWLLHLKRDCCPLNRLSFNVIREICAYFGPAKLLAAVKNAVLSVYFIDLFRVKHRILPIIFPKNSLFCMYQDLFLFAFSGDFQSKEIGEISLRKYEIRSIPWKTYRKHPGICMYSSDLYVFGGLQYPSKRLKHSAKYGISAQKWVEMADMPSAKSGFTPVISGKDIYLSAVCGTDILDVFAVETEEFRAVTVQGTASREMYTSLACLVSGDILLIAGGERLIRLSSDIKYRWGSNGKRSEFRRC